MKEAKKNVSIENMTATPYLEPVENKSDYTRIEILINGKKVYAHFPNVCADTNLMSQALEILISSYLANGYGEDKNVSLVETE